MGIAVRGAVGLREGDGRSAGGRDPQQPGADRRRVDDGVVLGPRPAERIARLDEAHRRAALDLGLLQVALREERHPLVVRREERLPGAVRARDGARLDRVEVAQVEEGVLGPLPRHVGHRAAVARDGRRRGELGARRERDRQASRLWRDVRGPAPQCERSDRE